MVKKYFWLKLKDDFFTDKKIKKLRKVAGGDTYTIIYLKMQLLSLKNDGLIFFDDLESELYEEIALEIDEDEENVKFTLLFLIRYGLVEEVDEKSIAMIETVNNIGKESESASRVRALRERQKQKSLQCNVTENKCNTEIEIEIEIEKDIKNIPPTKSKAKYEESSPYYQMAQYLYNKILDNNPNAKEPNYQKWSNDFRLIVERDKRDTKQLKEIIDFTQTDSFWKTAVFSPSSIRDKYDRFVVIISEKGKNKKQISKNGNVFNPWEEDDFGNTTTQTNLLDNSF